MKPSFALTQVSCRRLSLRRLRLWSGWCLFVLLVTAVIADGKFYPPTAYPVDVTIPDQRAMICFLNGTERLVIETRFATAASNVAWVVPLPAKPEIEEATPGLFPTLQHLFRPKVEYQIPRLYAAWLFFGALTFLALTVRRTGALTLGDGLGCLLAGLGVGAGTWPPGGVVAALLFLWLVHGFRHGRYWVGDIVVVSALLILLAGLVLPMFASARGKGLANSEAPAQAVTVLERKLLPTHETTTVTAREPAALVSWLTNNGFAVGTNTLPVIADYVRDGWVFVAAKVRVESRSNSTHSVRPLSFTFPTDRAVYPMRLTGVDADGLDVELYVFGDARAEAPGFTVKHCGSTETRRTGSLGPVRAPSVPLAHPLLKKWVVGATVATRLNARLTSGQMREDVGLTWCPAAEVQEILYRLSAARTKGANLAVPPAIVTWLIVTIWWRRWPCRFPRNGWVKLMGPVTIIVAAVGVVETARLPTVEVVLRKFPGFWSRDARHWMAGGIAELATNGIVAISDARKYLTELPNWPSVLTQNQYLDGRIREEDSPGNYTIRGEGSRVRLFWYEADGTETEMPFD